MKAINHLNHKLVELWRWNAAVGKRNEAAVVRGFGKIRPLISKLISPFAAYARSWNESIQDALWLPMIFHGMLGAVILLVYQLLTNGIPLPNMPIADELVFGFWSYLAGWGSKVVMVVLPQPYAWFANRFETFVNELVALGT